MRFANHDNRLTLITGPAPELTDARGVDVHRASGGSLPHDPELALERWPEVVEWASGVTEEEGDVVIDPSLLASPSPRPRQIFGVGINYPDHGVEADMESPEVPLVFTKLAPSVTGPFAAVELASGTVDWEAEVAVVIGREARAVGEEDAWSVVAGVTAGQDLSDREVQWRPKATPQFSLGKSLPGFAPLGPLLVTPDEFPDPDDIEVICHLNGEEVQRGRTSQMLFSVPALIAYLSSVTVLLPGDVIFTGTPGGIGMTRNPPRFLAAGDRLDTAVQGVGTMSNSLRAADGARL